MILDAGCGHGEAILAVAPYNPELVAMDLSSSVDIVQKRIERLPLIMKEKIHIVQANLFDPPLKPGVFDLIHSAGVLHHAPNTKRAFQGIAPLTKNGGNCFIEVYSNEYKNFPELVVHHIFRAMRFVTLRLPLSMLHVMCWILALPF